MNYEEVAKKILSDWDNYCFKLLDGDTPAFDIQVAIAAALRLAANEAARDAYVLGHGCASMACAGDPEASDMFAEKMVAKYGPRPEGGTR